MSCTWLTMREVAVYLSLDYTTVQKYCTTGKLKSIMPEGTRLRRICLTDLNEFLGVGADED